MRLIARAGMNDEAGRLIDDEQIIIFEQQMQRDFLRLRLNLFQRRFDQPNDIAGVNFLSRARLLFLPGNGAGADQILQARARKLRKRKREKPIEAQAFVVTRCR